MNTRQLKRVFYLNAVSVLIAAGFLAGCKTEDSTNNGGNSNANLATAVASELSSVQVHPLLTLKSATFGPCKKKSSAWKVQRGDHELRLVFKNPANDEAKKLLNTIISARMITASGRALDLYPKGKQISSGRFEITCSALVPRYSKEHNPWELRIESATFDRDTDPPIVFSKKFEIIPTPAQPPAKPFANVDPARLRFPPGWNGFESSIGNRLTEEGIPELLKSARSYIDSPARPHPHDLDKIPRAFINSAKIKLKSGKTEEALQILEELQQHGGVFYDLLERPDFDDIREEPRFKAVYEFGKAEKNADFYGKYLVRQPPLLTLTDFQALELSPPLPDLNGKVFVISTGGPHMFDENPLAEGVKCGVEVHAIVAQNAKLEVPEGATVHQSTLAHNSLVFNRTSIIWFGGKDGNVVAFLRPYSGSEMATSIVEYLKQQ